MITNQYLNAELINELSIFVTPTNAQDCNTQAFNKWLCKYLPAD